MKFKWFQGVACAVVLSLVMTACGRQEPLVEESDAGVTETPAIVGEVVEEQDPQVASVEQAALALSAGEVFLESRAIERYTAEQRSKSGVLTYTVPLAASETLIWSYYWCATTPEILEQNIEQMDILFELNGEVLPLERFAMSDLTSNGNPCRMTYTALSGWSRGEHRLVTSVMFKSAINDGMGEYPAGEYVSEYLVTVP